MFCPIGFQSLAKLWERYREKRLQDFYVNAAKHCAREDFLAAFVRGSPLDICEHIFLKSASECGLYLASPKNQEVMRIHAAVIDGRVSLLSVLPVRSSALWNAANKVDDHKSEAVELLASAKFKPWHGEAHEDALWSEDFPEFSSKDGGNWKKVEERLRYHCLPLGFERSRFLVAQDLLSWTRNLRHTGDLEVLVEHFGGRRSACLTKRLKLGDLI